MTLVYIREYERYKYQRGSKRLLERLPDDLTWDDLMHEIYVRQSIEAGLADNEAGKVVEVSDVRKQLLSISAGGVRG
jgi:hypothetical protein